MHTVVVHIDIFEKDMEMFLHHTLDNVKSSRKEPGVVRFDFFQENEIATRFLLIEIYKTPEDQDSHRQTAHYLTWKKAVEPMMAQPRHSEKYRNLIPLEGIE